MSSLSKAISILDSFSPDSPELGVADISRRVGIPKPTTHRLLMNLVREGIIEKRKGTGKYVIGARLHMIGSLYLNTDIMTAAQPIVESLNELTGEVSSLAHLERGYAVVIIREETKYAFRWSHVGSVLPAHGSAMGKALLSELTKEELDIIYPEETLVAVAPKSLKTKTELKRNLEQIRKTGISFSKEELVEGVEGIARVVRNASGKSVAAISIGVPVIRLSDSYRSRMTTMVRLGADLASYRLGYRDPACKVHDIEGLRSWWNQHRPDISPTHNRVV
jgi:DNA-binding IclR family transcriptional regulator